MLKEILISSLIFLEDRMFFFLAIILHTLCDGIILSEIQTTSIFKFSLRYVAQKFLESFLLGIFVYFAKIESAPKYSIIYFYALCAPLGMIIGDSFSQYNSLGLENLRCCLTAVSLSMFFFILLLNYFLVILINKMIFKKKNMSVNICFRMV